jgi:hypothetical protein
MKSSLVRSVAFTALLGISVSSLGCGYILHPERRGNSGGTISGSTLVMDCLWLLAGIIPGVVFLIVDFSSGAIYVKGGGAQMVASGKLKVDILDSKDAKTLRVRVVDASKRVLDEQTAEIGPGIRGRSVELDIANAPPSKSAPLFIQIVDARRPTMLLQSLQVFN